MLTQIPAGTPLMPLPEVTAAEMAFGLQEDKYPEMDAVPEAFRRQTTYENIAAGIFFSGTRTGQHEGKNFWLVGKVLMAVKDGHDAKQVQMALIGILSSYMPSHQRKMAVASWAIYSWFDIIDEDYEPPVA